MCRMYGCEKLTIADRCGLWLSLAASFALVVLGMLLGFSWVWDASAGAGRESRRMPTKQSHMDDYELYEIETGR